MSLAIRGNTFLKIFSAGKAILELVDQKWTQISTLLAILTPEFWQFWDEKSQYLFFKVFLDLCRKYSGIVFDLKRPTFGCIFSSKRR